MTLQDEIHSLELKKDHVGAAHKLIELRFYQVGRASGMLSRFPIGKDGNDMMREVLGLDPLNPKGAPWPQYLLMPFIDERAAGVHYLTFYAQPHDRIYIRKRTMDAYKKAGGGVYPGVNSEWPWGAEKAKQFITCRFCGEPANWMGLVECESCNQVTSRLHRFMKHEKGREHVLRLIGVPGLYELAVILQGEEDAKRRNSAGHRKGMEDEEGG